MGKKSKIPTVKGGHSVLPIGGEQKGTKERGRDNPLA